MPRISPIYPLPVSLGGTGQAAASDALQSLGGLPKYWTVVDQGTSANDLSSYSGVGAWWGNIKDGPQGGSNSWQEIVMFGDYQLSFFYTGDSIAPACYIRGKVNGVWQPWVRMDNNDSRECSTTTTSSSSDITTTSSRDIISISHTSRTGRVLISANMILKTSRYTSSMNVYAGSTHLGNRRTNITTPTRMEQHNTYNAPIGTAVTYKIVMTSQDSGTTATFPSYTTAEITVMDL